MNMQKCLCSLSGKYSKLLPYISRNRNHLRTYAHLTAERNELRILHLPLSVKVCSSASTHHSALKNEDNSKDMSLYPQPLQFEDLSFDQPVPHEDLINALYKCKTVSEQMEMLASTVSLSPDDIKNRMKLCRTLELLFKPFFDDVKIQIFGSTVNGLGFKGCDIDLSFEALRKEKFKSSDKEQARTPGEEMKGIEEPNIPLISEVLSGRVTKQEVLNLPPKDKLHFIHNVLLEYYKESTEPAIFINAHVPLVRFYHDKYGLKFDLTYKNKVAFANTKLLYVFNKLDKRVTPFIMTIRYWAKHHEIIGKGFMFNSYTITLLGIFFLQTRNPPILPSAESILEIFGNFRGDEDDEKVFTYLDKMPPSTNSQSLEELLREFFFFYAYFDFNRVVCPMTATAEPKEEFFSQLKIKESKFKNNTFCIQDPMCLGHNVAELVDFKYCLKYVHKTVHSCSIFQKGDTLNPSSNPWGLISQFDTSENYKNVFSSKFISCSIPLVSNSMDGDIRDSERISTTVDTIQKILEYAFLFNCKRLNVKEYLSVLKKQDDMVLKVKKESETKAKSKLLLKQIQHSLYKKSGVVNEDSSANNLEVEETMLEQFQKLNAENQLILCAKYKISGNVWDDRHLVKLDQCASKNILEKEHLISKLTAEGNQKKKVMEPYLCLCECFVSKDRPDKLILNFRPYKNPYFKFILGIFLREYLPQIMKNIRE